MLGAISQNVSCKSEEVIAKLYCAYIQPHLSTVSVCKLWSTLCKLVANICEGLLEQRVNYSKTDNFIFTSLLVQKREDKMTKCLSS